MVMVADPGVAVERVRDWSISQVIRRRLSNARLRFTLPPNEAFIKPPNGEYAGDWELAHNSDEAVCAEKSVPGCVASLQLLDNVRRFPAASYADVKESVFTVGVNVMPLDIV